MLGKAIVIILVLAIAFNLFRGFYFLISQKAQDKKQVARSLSWRVGLSALLFVLLFVLHYFGIIELHQLPQQPAN